MALPPRLALLALPLLLAGGCGGTVDSSEPSAGERALERYGIAVVVPEGWHARVTRGTVEAATVPLGERPAARRLGLDDLAVDVYEFEPVPGSFHGWEIDRTHSSGPPAPFRVEEFGPPDCCDDNPGDRGFARRNFRVAGRYFDLFVESGSLQPTPERVAELNELLSTLEVQAGDFYPGRIAPPRFEATQGWHVGAADGGEVRATDYAEAWAATVPYLNEPRDLPPARTLETLPPDGVLLWVGVARDNRYPPTSEVRRGLPHIQLPLRLADMKGGPGWEGQVRDISLYRLHGLVPERYHVDAWVFFGRAEPSPEQRAGAQAMLDALVMPDWGPWELDGRGDVSVGAG